jgi:hypothetical protein
VGSNGIAQHEVLVLNALRRLLELGPAMMHAIAGWSGFGTTQPSSGAILPRLLVQNEAMRSSLAPSQQRVTWRLHASAARVHSL